VEKEVEGADEIKSSVIPAGEVVSTLHVGEYKDIEPAYNALIEWAKTNKKEFAGVSYEFYLNDPAQTAPEKLETRIEFPVK